MNVALTIPARVCVGVLVDKLGPRLMYAALLSISGVLCIGLRPRSFFRRPCHHRFLLAFVGAGFVVGIRIISDWFRGAKETAYAQGIYAGLGNFGSAAAAVTLPTLAMVYGGPDGWRWRSQQPGVIAIVYSVVYYRGRQRTYRKVRPISAQKGAAPWK